MEIAKAKLASFMKLAEAQHVDVRSLKSVQQYIRTHQDSIMKHNKRGCVIFLAFVAIYCWNFYVTELQSARCLLSLPPLLCYAFRPPEDCSFCSNIQDVPRLAHISSDDFEQYYAYRAIPVVVTDATRNWSALQTFDYWYFREVYGHAKRKNKILDCQFLPYQTGFRDIFEALDMPAQRVRQENNTAPWYFGWSNCNPETAEEFRRHYGRPYFLPKNSENNAVDWFFIGTAGLGAQMHVDNVRLPSWQAQLRGSKRWVLAPPPECFFRCKQLEIVVQTGDIIVLDTNKWYHQTFVQPGELSLTIGAEYD